jgi:hypothetical protein
MATKKNNELKLATEIERQTAMNDIAVMFCEKNKLSHREIQANFGFIISDILLEFELAGLIVQMPGQQFILVEATEVVTEEKTEINNRLVQIAEQMALLQQEQQELEIKLARLEETETVAEVETATIKETTTVTVDAALQNAYNDYKNKLAKAKKWFDFEPSEYIGNSIHDKIIVWNKEIYYSSHPAFKPGDKFSSHIMNCIAYRKKRTPNQGRSKKFKV